MKKQFSRLQTCKGRGIINSLINKLPVELHLPGYQYCGPGTKLKERLARGDPGINKLDQACKEHDIFYSKYREKDDRHIADKILAEKAWQLANSKDTNFGERINSWIVAITMKTKKKLGMGLKKIQTKQNNKIKKRILLRNVIQNARNVLKKHKNLDINDAVKIALIAAKRVVSGKKSQIIKPRIIPVPKTGGVIPLLPIFAGLSALGALSGGTASVIKAIKDTKLAQEQFKENQRHNQAMESIVMGKGLHLKPYKKGYGLYLTPKNF